jgi:hypothetical protein
VFSGCVIWVAFGAGLLDRFRTVSLMTPRKVREARDDGCEDMLVEGNGLLELDNDGETDINRQREVCFED